jgi:hypothetical protein
VLNFQPSIGKGWIDYKVNLVGNGKITVVWHSALGDDPDTGESLAYPNPVVLGPFHTGISYMDDTEHQYQAGEYSAYVEATNDRGESARSDVVHFACTGC